MFGISEIGGILVKKKMDLRDIAFTLLTYSEI